MKIVYTREGCEDCKNAIEALKNSGEEIEVRDAEALLSGEYKDTDAMAELHLNDFRVPVIVDA